jgi:hypothetical protein
VSNDAPTIPAEQKSASKNSLAGNRLQKCKHPNGKVPFFHDLKSSQNPLPAWVHAQRLHICEKAQGKVSMPKTATIHRKIPLFSLTKRKRKAL